MCKFISWVEKGDRVYFLTMEQLNSEEGKHFVRVNGVSSDDFSGHGTIRRWYGLENHEGTERECTDFASPNNFPPVIAEAIKQGKMRGALERVSELLTPKAEEEYNRIKEQAEEEYNRINEPAGAEYNRINEQAWAEYNRIKEQAEEEYNRINKQSFWDLFTETENRAKAWR